MDQQQLQHQMFKQGCSAALQEHSASCRQEPAVNTKRAQRQKMARRDNEGCGMWELTRKSTMFCKSPCVETYKKLNGNI